MKRIYYNMNYKNSKFDTPIKTDQHISSGKSGEIIKAENGWLVNFWNDAKNNAKKFYEKMQHYHTLGGGSANAFRDARIGAVGAQQIRDLYTKGDVEKANDLATQYAKANISGITMASAAANPYGLIGDAAITTAATISDSAIEGNTNGFKENLATNLAFDVIGKGVGDVVQYGWNTTKPYILRFLPESMIPRNGAKNSTKTLREHITDFHDGLTSSHTRYSEAISSNPAKAQQLKNKTMNKIQKYLPTSPGIEDIRNAPNLEHTYSYRVNPETGKTEVLLDAFSGKDISHAGNKMGSELALTQITRNTYPNSIYFPQKFKHLFKIDNNFNNVANLMAVKNELGIKASFDAISDAEIEYIFREGWRKGIWNPISGYSRYGQVKHTADEFWKIYNHEIKQLMRLIPVTAGAAVVLNQKGDQ